MLLTKLNTRTWSVWCFLVIMFCLFLYTTGTLMIQLNAVNQRIQFLTDIQQMKHDDKWRICGGIHLKFGVTHEKCNEYQWLKLIIFETIKHTLTFRFANKIENKNEFLESHKKLVSTFCYTRLCWTDTLIVRNLHLLVHLIELKS